LDGLVRSEVLDLGVRL